MQPDRTNQSTLTSNAFRSLEIMCFSHYVACSSFMGHAISIRPGPPVLNFFRPLFLRRVRGVQSPLGGQTIWAVKISFPCQENTVGHPVGLFSREGQAKQTCLQVLSGFRLTKLVGRLKQCPGSHPGAGRAGAASFARPRRGI